MSGHVKLEKFLCLILRHKPETIGLALDENGWVSVEALILHGRVQFPNLNWDTLHHIVRESEKQRFEIDVTGELIRARQGHSIQVDLGLSPIVPPPLLYHGTALTSFDSIMVTGINHRTRTQVQLSHDVDTAISVGKRHGRPVVLTISAQEMHKAGKVFYLSTNNVWLTNHVPSSYISGIWVPNGKLQEVLDTYVAD
jgi:putative RNA 2'-phosphotransferase